MSRLRLVALLAVLGGVAFGFWGGEYSTVDWWQLRREVTEQQRSIAALAAELDSLEVRATLLERDPVTQERAAREKFGMIRPGETLYRVEGIH